jgi:hypothetical protein
VKIYFHNIGKRSSFILNHCFLSVLFVVDILFSIDIIKLTEFIKLIRANYVNIFFIFLKKYLPLLDIFYAKKNWSVT